MARPNRRTPRKAPPKAAAAGRASRADAAYDALFGAIESGTLRPGARLREIELSDWVGASRTPIREALGRLEAEGLVARDPSRGMVVAELDHGLVAELYVMREVLEGTAAALAARHASDAEIDALRELARRDRDAGDDPARLARLNRHFHEAMFRCAHNRFLMRAVHALRQSMVLLGQTTLAVPGRPETARAEHDAIVSAIARHDAEAAAEAARTHIRAAYRTRLGLMLEAP
jgi:DNA-binding GntR family transcriptional regulator